MQWEEREGATLRELVRRIHTRNGPLAASPHAHRLQGCSYNAVAGRCSAAAHPWLRSDAESAVTVSLHRGERPGVVAALCSDRSAMAR